MTTRRTFLHRLGATALGVTLPVRLSFAAAAGEARLVVVLLRGGWDGLNVAPPHGDPNYDRLRPRIGVPPPGNAGGALDLDGLIGLNPELAALKAWYDGGELVAFPAMGIGYVKRSHFDAQDVLENGTGRPKGAYDGWLGRALMAKGDDPAPPSLAVNHSVPLILRGKYPAQTLAPSRLPTPDGDFLDRVRALYRLDAAFERPFETALKAARGEGAAMMKGLGGGGRGGRLNTKLVAAAGRVLAGADGPRVAVIDTGGWDTHGREGPRLRAQLTGLAKGLVALRQGLGAAWANTAILLVSEFGRTAAENGSAGTDHGTGGLAFALGGAVRGGRIVGGWPGLAPGALYQGRDLRATGDIRALFKAALRDHLGLAEGALEDQVFPDSRQIRPLEGLFKA